MPFVAECPQCEARLRVPARRAGESVLCPRCSFELSDVAPAPPRATSPETESGTPPVPHDDPLRLALVAIALAGVASLASYIPYGRIATVLGTLVGLGLAAVALLGLERRRWVGATAAGVNAAVLFLAAVAPSWLAGSRPKPPEDDSPKTPVALWLDGAAPKPTDWVPADRAGWRHADVRAVVASVGVVPEPAAKGAKRGKDRVLKVTVTLTNVGVARGIDVTGWAANTPAEPRLVTTDGAPRPLHPETDAQPRATLYPGKSADFVFLFACPPGPPTDLRLELPGAAFGGEFPVRFQIPARMIAGTR